MWLAPICSSSWRSPFWGFDLRIWLRTTIAVEFLDRCKVPSCVACSAPRDWKSCIKSRGNRSTADFPWANGKGIASSSPPRLEDGVFRWGDCLREQTRKREHEKERASDKERACMLPSGLPRRARCSLANIPNRWRLWVMSSTFQKSPWG